MHYYRKAAAVFIIVLTLMLPLFLKKEEETAVVNLDQVIAASTYLTEIKIQNSADPEIDDISQTKIRTKIMKILKKESAKLAESNSYSSILIDQTIYKGGKDITQELAAKIDENYNRSKTQ